MKLFKKKEPQKSHFDELCEELNNRLITIRLVMLDTARTFQSMKKHVSNQANNLKQSKEHFKNFSKYLVLNYD